MSATAELEAPPSAALVRHDAFMKRVDALCRHLVESYPKAVLPVFHTFTPGLYSRRVFMGKGTVAVSKIHKHEHQFCVLLGRVKVVTEEDEEPQTVYTGFHGVTKPGTRRAVIAMEDTIWITFHPTDKLTVEEVEEEIIEPYEVPTS